VSLHALARVLWTRKAYDAALVTFREALVLQRKHLSRAHPDLVRTLADVATCHEILGQHNLAAQRLGELVTRLRQGGAATASALPRALKRLGDMTLRAGRAAPAEKHYLEARRLAAAATSLPDRDRQAFDAELDSRLAILYARTNRAARAEALLHKALAVFQRNAKAHADPLVRCLIQLAKLQRGAGKLAEATQTVRNALNVVRKHQGHRTYAYARALAELAAVYAAQKANEQAARILARAFEIVHKLYGGKHPRTARLRARLVELYTALGWKEQLKELPR
jgi:tetratricopeptide (TPR) repeat protein